MTAVLEEIGRELQEKYPYCKFWGITIHRDEPNGIDHMDIRYTIFIDGEKTGLGKRVSMNKGLAKMGFHSTAGRTALQEFQDAIKDDMQEKMEARGYTRLYMDNHEKHRKTSVFQAEKDKEAAIAEMEEALAERDVAITERDKAIAKIDERQKNLDSYLESERIKLGRDRVKAKQEVKEAEERKRKADEDLKTVEMMTEGARLTLDNTILEILDAQEEFDGQKKSMDESKQLLEELFCTMVRSMRGQGHEQDEVEFPDTNAKIAEVLRAEMAAWQERLLQERQSMFARMNELFEQMKKSADLDESRKRFMERTKVGGTDKTMEDVYQESIAKKHAKDEQIHRDAAEIAGVSLDDRSKEFEGME